MKEDEFILNAARLHLTKENITALKKLAGSSLDWSLMAKNASRHCVSNLMYYALKKHDLTALLPKELLKKFQAEYYEIAIINANLLEIFKEIVSLLPNKVIPLKGIELIQSLYPNIAIRSMCDIDLLVEQSCAEKNWHQLLQEGYDSFSPLHTVKKSGAHSELPEKCLHLPQLCRDKISVEVHRSLFQDSRFQEVTRQALASSVNISGNRHRLTQEMMLIHLCTHFYKHTHTQGVTLRGLCDINELLRKYEKTLNWDEIEQICSEPELRYEVAMGLSYAHILLTTPVPEQFLTEKLLKKRETILSSFFDKELYVEDVKLPLLKRLKKYSVSLKQLPSLAKKMAFVFRTFVPQKEWMAEKYDVSTAGNLAIAYPRYWLELVNTYLIGGRGNMQIRK